MPVTYSSGNILVNGNGEAAPGASNFSSSVAIPGWVTSGVFTTVGYIVGGGTDLNDGDGRALQGGVNYFAGGPGQPTTSATQTIDLADHAAEIDAGGIDLTLSGQFGGFSTQDDSMTMQVTFLDGSGNSLGTGTIGGYDSADRLGQSTLLGAVSGFPVPTGTRSVLITLTADRGSGSYNDGYCDNLAVTLTGLGSGFVEVFSTRNYSTETLQPSVGVHFESAHSSQATFRSSQFGATGLSLTSEIQGSYQSDRMQISVVANATFSAAGFTFEDWTEGKDRFTFVSGGGAENVTGTSQNDIFKLGAGADRMTGGNGNDTYSVDNANDLVFEALMGGNNDTVNASTNYTLRNNQEIERLVADAGSTGLTLTGNNLANSIIGGDGGDTLKGGAGFDRLTGGDGADSFVLSSSDSRP